MMTECQKCHTHGVSFVCEVCGGTNDDPKPYAQLLRDLRAERDHWKEECTQLEKRRDELLKLIYDLSRNAISADEAAELRARSLASLVCK